MNGCLSLEEVMNLSDEDAWKLRELYLTLHFYQDQQSKFTHAVVQQQMKITKKELRIKSSIEE